ncbi:hypothetical protein SPI_05961 [Niveomyces insectorum RCEF 264]|uniref:Rhodopsin domain-containing protein n=1 Tax=Niveomyces insectorum RCEF 264 TaxID=1081102 RepID=A0A167SMR8_9HYPO|nr:hypothetical protein SPI_05961 [Niveomyces insectorum RCEF 264]
MAVDSNAPRIVISLSVMTGVAFVFMALRFFCKGRYHKRFGFDDYMLAAAWVCLVAYAVLTITSTNYGIGLHISFISSGDLVTALRLLYVGRFLAVIALAISKTSFAVTLLHLAMTGWQRYALWFIIVSLNIVMWFSALSLFIQCNPVYKAWDLSAAGSCWNPQIQVNIGISAGAYSAAMDFILALFPSFLIWNLQMKKAEKFAVTFAMSLGVFAGITAIIKTYFISGSQRSKDFTFTTANLLIWSGAETAVTIIAASIPFLRLLLKDLSGKGKSTPRPDTYYLEQMSRNTRVVNPRASAQLDDESEKSILGDTKRGQLRIEQGQAKIDFA